MALLEAPPSDSAGAAQAAFGPLGSDYDLYTGHPLFDRWILSLEELVLRHGLTGRRLLDVGCGTGSSFLPFLAKGYDVTGCDAVAEMLDVARLRSDGAARVEVVQLPDLPLLGEFDLVMVLNDVCNYLLSASDLRATVVAAARNLRRGGLLLFDTNTLATFRGVFAETHWRENGDRCFVWHGHVGDDFAVGDTAHATLEVLTRSGALWSRTTTEHFQRHHPEAEVVASLAGADLQLLGLYGQDSLGVRSDGLSSDVHPKALWVARKP